jgi:hypothetical protein
MNENIKEVGYWRRLLLHRFRFGIKVVITNYRQCFTRENGTIYLKTIDLDFTRIMNLCCQENNWYCVPGISAVRCACEKIFCFYVFIWRMGSPTCLRFVSPYMRVCSLTVCAPRLPFPKTSIGCEPPRWRVCLPYLPLRVSAAS